MLIIPVVDARPPRLDELVNGDDVAALRRRVDRDLGRARLLVSPHEHTWATALEKDEPMTCSSSNGALDVDVFGPTAVLAACSAAPSDVSSTTAGAEMADLRATAGGFDGEDAI